MWALQPPTSSLGTRLPPSAFVHQFPEPQPNGMYTEGSCCLCSQASWITRPLPGSDERGFSLQRPRLHNSTELPGEESWLVPLNSSLPPWRLKASCRIQPSPGAKQHWRLTGGHLPGPPLAAGWMTDSLTGQAAWGKVKTPRTKSSLGERRAAAQALSRPPSFSLGSFGKSSCLDTSTGSRLEVVTRSLFPRPPENF